MKNYSYAVELTKQKLSNKHPLNNHTLILRDTRLQLGLTLEEVSKQICTPSYLSRIEKGEVKPKSIMLEKLYTRLAIPLNFKADHPYRWIKPFRLALEQYNLQYLHEGIQTEILTYYYQQILKKFILKLTAGNLDEITSHYNYLLTFQDDMHLDELELFYHYVGLYFSHHYSLSLQYLRLASQLNKKMSKQDTLLSLHFAQHYFKYGHFNRGIHHLQDATQFFSNNHFMKYMIDCELLLCDYYIKHQIFSKARPLLFKLYHYLKFQDDYQHFISLLVIIGHYHKMNNQYDEAEKMYLEALQLNPKFIEGFVALLELYHCSNQSHKQFQLTQWIKQDQIHTNTQLLIQSNYYEFLNESNFSDKFRVFLLKEAMPNAKNNLDFRYYYKYTHTLIEYYESIGKYKSALKLYHDLKEKGILYQFAT